ncbi:hypothetical protein HAX54_017516, partial [Datura stramonium]|nr:hypothetical protein [Datura stramonium]
PLKSQCFSREEVAFKNLYTSVQGHHASLCMSDSFKLVMPEPSVSLCVSPSPTGTTEGSLPRLSPSLTWTSLGSMPWLSPLWNAAFLFA